MKIKGWERLVLILEISSEILIVFGTVIIASLFGGFLTRDFSFNISIPDSLWLISAIVMISIAVGGKVTARKYERRLIDLRRIYPYSE